MAKYIFVRSVDSETAAELRAAVVVEGRGYKRRSAPAEGSPAPTLEEVVTAVHSAVRVAIVEREELIAEGLKTQNGFADYLHSQISDSAFADLIASTLITDSIHRRTLFETIELEARMSLLLEMLGSAAEST
jgi:hypothetical protein